jgi:MFS transporter, PHS family, inorganic phosphate transporter
MITEDSHHVPGQLPPRLLPDRFLGAPEAYRPPLWPRFLHLPACPRRLVRLPAIMRSLVVHSQVGGALLKPDSFRPSRGNAARRKARPGGTSGGGNTVTEMRSRDLIAALDEASLSRFHMRAVLASGMGFFTDAYDLFVIGIASALITKDWTLSSGRLALLNSTMLAAACLGAFVFGRFADVIGRKRVYWMVAAIMIAGALGSALAPSYWVLIGFRFVLGFGVGGDYPVSAVMVSEYANRKDRGKLVGMVFGTQALGLIVGPLIALTLLGAGASNDVAWRVMLALGAVPAAAVIYLRCRMPESPRYQVQVQGKAEQAASRISDFSGGQVSGNGSGEPRHELGLRAFLTDRRWLIMLAGTAGTWFLLDYAYYGNTISTPQILGLISPHASTMTKIAIQLAIFVVAAVPGYVLAIARLDKIGHRRLQLIGFAMMAACFAFIALVPGMTTVVVPFLLVYGVSYFFTEFGPNMTTFVMPSELYPVTMRATGHGISAGIGKFGAFIGVFLFPLLQTSLGLRGTLLLTAGVSVLGLALTLVLPEPAGISLEEMPSARRTSAEPLRVADQASAH